MDHKEWRKKNPEKMKMYKETRNRKRLELGLNKGRYNPEYYQRRKEIYRLAQEKWLEKNKEQQKEYHKEYYQEHKQTCNSYYKSLDVVGRKAYYQKYKERVKKYYEEHKEELKKKRDEYHQTEEYKEKRKKYLEKQKEKRRLAKIEKRKDKYQKYINDTLNDKGSSKDDQGSI